MQYIQQWFRISTKQEHKTTTTNILTIHSSGTHVINLNQRHPIFNMKVHSSAITIQLVSVKRRDFEKVPGGSESPAFRTTFSRPPYFCAPLPPDYRPSLCCSRLQVNQEDQKPGFNFQTVPKLDILVRFLAFVLAGGSLIPDESYYRSVFLIKLSFTNQVITVWPSLLISRYREESLSSLCTVIAIAISKSNLKKTKGRSNV